MIIQSNVHELSLLVSDKNGTEILRTPLNGTSSDNAINVGSAVNVTIRNFEMLFHWVLIFRTAVLVKNR